MVDLMSHDHFSKSRNINQDIWSHQCHRLADEKQALSDITGVPDLNTTIEGGSVV